MFGKTRYNLRLGYHCLNQDRASKASPVPRKSHQQESYSTYCPDERKKKTSVLYFIIYVIDLLQQLDIMYWKCQIYNAG